jgi:hypothetical protein
MWKSGPKVGPVNVRLPGRFGKVETMAARTKDIDGIVAGQVGQADRQDRLPLTKYMRTAAKVRQSVLLVHGVHPAVGDNIAANST